MNDIMVLCKKEWRKVSLSILLTLVIAVGSLYTVYGRMTVLDMMLERSTGVWYQIGFLILLLVLVECFNSYLRILNAQIVKSWKLYLGRCISRNIERMSYQQFHALEEGEHLTNYTYTLEVVATYLLNPLLSFSRSLVLSVISFFFLALISGWLALFALFSTLILVFVGGRFGKKISQGYTNLSLLNGQFTSRLKEYIAGYDVLRNVKQLYLLPQKIYERQLQKEAQEYEIARLMSFALLSYQSVQRLFEMLIFALTIILISRGTIHLGAIVSAPTILSIFLESSGNLTDVYAKLRGTDAQLHGLMTVADLDEEEFPSPVDSISFSQVGHSYGDKQIFEGLTLRFNIGGKYALVGKSGSGKSTILKLLLGRLTCEEGEIRINDQPYAPKKDVNFSRQIGYMTQEVFLFTDSVRFNICLGDIFTDEEIWSVLRQVGLERLVRALPNQLEESVGELGGQFSGGEKQRIALARILIRKLPIVLLDEATSAVDAPTARMIEEALLRDPDRTVVMISHHLQEDLQPYFTSIITLS
ncbi:ATP-binding cassette domain-containing protein [Streptococcus sp. zg-86]|uniref:ATP-binding cassette domain-containing protein n=1 Tax=Streptococcus zhangguiae TaxID=2664091 RepID=A0A6I4RHZ2_9STRE|nr:MULTISPECIES: ABC transporter ATP-binding protein [unclassified Streptococcus]MTB64440.1 ATP-binding cassette domain-containing protein [Streptococcus sp. zg-86]MTB90870.1 ATP-binding cassette domain-containing protein [Streptococcus sp. zg-36]MWV56427.1 ATP-binding cassette domain-containing protein [Streptococcus sp. zg-70]QTH47366.1 ABC transporter ATP-binding protein [Streptococcus sp. zg-86]